jgi:5-oxoprolinase (ATP-hydrolysing)
MRVRRYRLRRGSGGSGAAAGGEGIERRVSRPWGLAGGGPGAVGENWLLPRGGGEAGEPARADPDEATSRSVELPFETTTIGR